MKTINFKIPAIIIALIFSIQLFGQQAATGVQTASFKVSGNCEMCKKRIEGASNKTKGVQTATWSAEKQEVTITYDAAKTSPQQVGQSIGKAGYDNEYAKAPASAYGKLPKCCKYTRETNN